MVNFNERGLIKIENEKQADELMELIAITGEFPADAVYRLGGREQYKPRLVSIMKNDGLIRLHHKDNLRGYRLNFKAKKMLLEKNRDRFEFFLTDSMETNRIKSEITRRIRLHRIANVTVTMHNAGIKLFRDEKPDIFSPENDTPTEITEPVFYSSREFKEMNHEMTKVKNARSVGVMLTPKEIYIAYNTEKYMMKWDYKAEISVKSIMDYYLCQICMPNQYRSLHIKGLFFGRDMEMLYQILSGGEKVTDNDSINKKERMKKKRNYFFRDDTFGEFIYLTNDKYGETGLKLLCDTGKRNELDAILISDKLKPPDKNMVIENDALDKNGNPVLFAYLIDIPRLSRFITALNYQDKHGGIICFNFQEKVLTKYCGGCVYIDTISFERFSERFFT